MLRELLLLLSPLPLFLPFLLSSPKGDLLLSLFLFEEPQQNGRPIHRALCDGWDANRLPDSRGGCRCLSLLVILSAAKTPPHFAFAFAFAVGIRAELHPGVYASREAAYPLPKAGAKPEERSDLLLPLIASAFAVILFFAFSAQKSHVKLRNHLNQTNKIRWSWHVSYVQSAILKRVEKNKKPRREIVSLRG
jgi:hypothetical protein